MRDIISFQCCLWMTLLMIGTIESTDPQQRISWALCKEPVCHEVQRQVHGLTRLKLLRNYIVQTMELMDSLVTSLDEELVKTGQGLSVFIGPHCEEAHTLLKHVTAVNTSIDRFYNAKVDEDLEASESKWTSTHTPEDDWPIVIEGSSDVGGGLPGTEDQSQYVPPSYPGGRGKGSGESGSGGTIGGSYSGSGGSSSSLGSGHAGAIGSGTIFGGSQSGPGSGGSFEGSHSGTIGSSSTFGEGQSVSGSSSSFGGSHSGTIGSGTGFGDGQFGPGSSGGFGGSHSGTIGSTSGFGVDHSGSGDSGGHFESGHYGSKGSGVVSGSGGSDAGWGGASHGSKGPLSGGKKPGSGKAIDGQGCRGVSKGHPNWVPGLDVWCNVNCGAGFCPLNTCIC